MAPESKEVIGRASSPFIFHVSVFPGQPIDKRRVKRMVGHSRVPGLSQVIDLSFGDEVFQLRRKHGILPLFPLELGGALVQESLDSLGPVFRRKAERFRHDFIGQPRVQRRLGGLRFQVAGPRLQATGFFAACDL
jgi:hypothetical protein